MGTNQSSVYPIGTYLGRKIKTPTTLRPPEGMLRENYVTGPG
jgi:hypothetical protein